MTRHQTSHWRTVRRPLTLTTQRGWQWGNACLISPRGTVFAVRARNGAVLARKRMDFQLSETE